MSVESPSKNLSQDERNTLHLKGEKYCNRCGSVKSIQEFHKNKNSPTGASTYCKACDSLDQKRKWATRADPTKRAHRMGNREYLELRLQDKKYCSKCCEIKTPIAENFSPSGRTHSGEQKYHNYCHSCRRKWEQNKKEKRLSDPEKQKYHLQLKTYHKYRTKESYARYLLYQVKARCQRKNLECDLSVQDIIIPDICPIFNIPLKMTPGERNDFTPSIDRLDPSKGYIKNNIHIISWKANRLKSDASLEDLKLLVTWWSKLEGEIK